MRVVLFLLLFAGTATAQPMKPSQPPTPAAPADNSSPEEQTVKAARLPATGPALVEFFKKRSLRTSEAAPIQELIKQLSEKEAEKRDRAFAGLVQFGAVAVPLLRQAAGAIDEADLAARARECLKFIEGDDGASLIAAAAQLLVQKNPEGAVEALLAYLPVAETPKVYQEVETALAGLATRDGKIHPALVKALKDSTAGLRASAASVICQGGDAAARLAVKPLLKDPRPIVRLRAALGLARRSEAEAIPVLIELLSELPEEPRAQCEEFLIELAGDWKIELPQGKTPILQKLRREVWAGWWKGTEGKVLLEEFRSRTLSNDDREKVLGLIRDLGKESDKDRQQALLALVNFGAKALPLLRQASEDGNLRISDGARRCVEQLQKDSEPPLPAVAARLLALHRPEGAAKALLAFVPFSDSEPLTEALLAALPDLATGQDGKADPAFLEALGDTVTVRRLAAIEALALVGGQQEALKKLLTDKDPEVRVRTALALAKAGDHEVLPTLIQVTSEVPVELAWQSDEYLSRLAGAKKPNVSPAKEAEAQKKYREAWAAWWKENGEKVVVAERTGATRLLGLNVIVEQHNQFTGNGRVLEMDASGKVRWEIHGLATPMDARVVTGNRVLIAEQNMNRITERDLKGDVKWEKQVYQPIVVERLKNGNTFVVRRNGILELDREGKEVYHIQRNSDYIMGGARLRDGTVAFVNNNNIYLRIDRQGREVKSHRVPHDPMGGGIQPWVLPNGHVLLSHHQSGKVLELDREGKTIWEAKVQWPHIATRLPNGNILVSSINNRKVTEIDRTGKVVRELTGNMQPYKAERR